MLDTHAVVRSLTDAEIHAGPGGRHHERGPSGRRTRRPCPARSVHGQPRRGEGRNRRGADGDRRVAEAPVPVPSTDALPGPRSRRSARLRLLELAHRKPGGGGLTDCPRSRDRDRRHAAQRHRRDRRCRPARLPRRLAGRRARHAVRPKASACRSSRLARAGAPSRTRSAARPRAWPSDTLTGGRVRRLARPAAPRPPPRRSWPLAQAAIERHRFRAAASGGRGRRRMADAPSAPARASDPTRTEPSIFFGSPAAGERLQAMFAPGASRPWRDGDRAGHGRARDGRFDYSRPSRRGSTSRTPCSCGLGQGRPPAFRARPASALVCTLPQPSIGG